MQVPKMDQSSFVVMTFCLFFKFMALQVNGSHMYDDETCSESRKTVTRVDQCPQNLSSWIEREKMKNCASYAHNCSRPFFYHCVINPWQNEMMEVCAPSTKINAGYCAEYNTEGGRIQDFSFPTCASCKNQYDSTEAYKYRECYDAVTDTNNKMTVTYSSDHESKRSTLINPVTTSALSQGKRFDVNILLIVCLLLLFIYYGK